MYNFTDLVARSYLEYTKEKDDDIAYFFYQEFNQVCLGTNINYTFSQTQFYRKLILKIDNLINASYAKIEATPLNNRYISLEEKYYEMERAEERRYESEREDAAYESYLEEIGITYIPPTPKNWEECDDAIALLKALNNGLQLVDAITIVPPNKEIQADDLVLRKSKLEYLKTEAIRARDAKCAEELDINESLQNNENNNTNHINLTVSTPKREQVVEEFVFKALEIIKPLGGIYIMDRLLNDADMKRLNNYVEVLITTGNLPSNLLPFPRTSIPNQFIRKTIRLVYKLIGKKYRSEFIELTNLFKQFEGAEFSTIDSKFSTYEGKYEKIKSDITF